jgi:hypothetical protein
LNGGHDYIATITPGGAVMASAVDQLLAAEDGVWIGGFTEGW